jgi:hypothetical protein
MVKSVRYYFELKSAVLYLRIADVPQESIEREVTISAGSIASIAEDIGAEVIARFYDRGTSNEGFNELLSYIAQGIPENLIIVDHDNRIVVQDFNRRFSKSAKAIKYVKKVIKHAG